MNVVLGVGKEKGTWREMTFSYATEELTEREGFLVGTVGAFIVWGAQLTRHRSVRTLLKATNLPKIMGMFTKIGDSPGGKIHRDGTVEKPYTAEDMEKFRKGTEICKKVLIRAGAIPESIMVAENIGGHPGGTAAIGKVVDRNLQVFGVDNLYVCDASVFPRSPGRPPTLTLIALGKKLAETIH
jgi:choline dehydrogenase-like flavoprotein